ncbi:MAG TPA: Holliday junction branch migration protein RuvA [Dehalococcoidia bacterium]|nr:Holliday junction branch migration protein RuvA [Dehalococcoidia bacterium]
MPIARLRGVVEDRGDDWVIVAVGGFGVLASVPASTAGALAPGDKASLFTHLHVREDAVTLFGFASRDDLALFEQLIAVNGVGPRMALGLLSSLPYAELTSAIAAGRSDVLRKVPGVGQKTAERIVLELRDKVTPPAAVFEAPVTKAGADEEVVRALMGLGYTQAEATAAAEAISANGDTPLEDRVREALAFFEPKNLEQRT